MLFAQLQHDMLFVSVNMFHDVADWICESILW